MGSGRKNRGSRHRSHKQKQLKPDDSTDSDTDQSLRHGPNPIPNPNHSPSPRPLHPLPPYFEGPSVLNQANVQPKGMHKVVLRKESLVSISAAAASMDQQKEDKPSSLLENLDRKFIVPGDALHSKGDGTVMASKGKEKEGRARSSSQHGNTIRRNPLHAASLININKELETDRYSNINAPQSARACSNAAELLALKHTAFELDKSSCQTNILVMEPEKKRPRRDELSKMPKEPGGALVQGNVRNLELEKEPESQIGCCKEESRDGERLRDKEPWQNQRESWKAVRYTDRKHKDESQKVDNGQENWPKVGDENRKANGSRDDEVEGELKDDRQKHVVCKLKVDSCKEEARKYLKQRDVREPEGSCKEHSSRGGVYKDEKSNKVRLTNIGDFAEQQMLKSDEYSSWHKGDKTSMKPRQLDKLEASMKPRQLDKLEQRRENFKEARWKVKSSCKGDQDEEEILKYQKEKLEKHNEEVLAQAKSKYEKKKEDKDQDNFSKQKEEEGIDHAADAHDRYEKNRRKREDNFKVRSDIETKGGKGKFVKWSDGEDMDGLERQGRGRSGFEGRVKCIETVSKYEKIHISNKDEKHRDDWLTGEGGLKEKGRGEGRMCSKDRLWVGSLQWKNASSYNKTTSAQKYARDKDDRQRNNSGLEKLRDKKRKEYGGNAEFSDEQEQEVIELAAADRPRLTQEASRNTGEKDGRHVNVVKGQSDRLLKQGKILDSRQLERKWNHGFAEPKERKGHVTDGPTARNQSNGSQKFDTLDTSVSDRDRLRPQSKLTEELKHLSNKDKSWQEKFGHGGKFEMNVVNQSSSGTRRSREENWFMNDNATEGNHPAPRPSTQDSIDEKRSALDHQPSLSPSHGDEELIRGSNPLLLNNATAKKQKHPNITKGVGSSKTRRVDSMGRCGPRHQGSQLNRTATDGSSAMRMPSNCPSGYSTIEPPPPPYRSSVDNSAAKDPPTVRIEGSNPRENGRYNRKVSGAHLRRSEIAGPGDIWGGFGVARWNYHNQVPRPGPIHTIPGFTQMGPRGLLGMGQQFHAPHMLGPSGMRPSADRGFSGAQFHMGDGEAGFPVHDPNFAPIMGWPRFPNGIEAHGPFSGLVDTWERPRQYLDEFSSFGHVDWGLYSQAMPGEGWEGACEQGQGENASIIVTQSHRESVCQVSIEDAASDPELHVEKVENEKDVVPGTVDISPAHTLPKALSKAGKFIKQRMQTMLLYANISVELAGIDLYRAYLNLLPPSKGKEAGTEDFLVLPDAIVDEDLAYEVDTEAQDLLLDTNPLQLFLPSFSDSAYKNALRVFQQRAVEQDRVQKSVVGSFLLPQSSLMIKMPIYDIGSVKRAHIVTSEVQLEVDHSGTVETKDKVRIGSSEEASGFEVTSLREMVEIHPNEKACIELESRPVEDSSVLGNQQLGSPEHSVFENSSFSRHVSIGHVSCEKNLENNGKSSVYELAINLCDDQESAVNVLANFHVADHLEAMQMSFTEAQSDVDQTRPINEVNYSCHNDLEVPYVFDREDSEGHCVEDKGEKLEVLSSANKESRGSFSGVEAFEITHIQECPKYVHGAWYHTNCTSSPTILQQCQRVTMLLSSFSSCGMVFRQFLDCSISYEYTFILRRNTIRNGNVYVEHVDWRLTLLVKYVCILLGHCDAVSFWAVIHLQLGFINSRRFLPWFAGSSSFTFILFLASSKDGYKSIAYVKCDITFRKRALFTTEC